MIIKKFLHSCILLEDKGKKLLIDPGAFCFIEKKITPKDIGPVDVILLTHRHPDHFFPDALKEFISFQPCAIVSNHDIASLLNQEGIVCQVMVHGESREISGFTIEAFEAPHCRLPTECPPNMAFRINKIFLHPGDSFTPATVKSCKVLALPVAGPFSLIDFLEFATLMRPEVVIPIHDAFIKDFMLERLYSIFCEPYLKNAGIRFSSINLGEQLEV